MNDWLKPYYQAALSPMGKVVIVQMDWSHCRRCGKPLRSVDARNRGYGKICWEKKSKDKQEKLF